MSSDLFGHVEFTSNTSDIGEHERLLLTGMGDTSDALECVRFH